MPASPRRWQPPAFRAMRSRWCRRGSASAVGALLGGLDGCVDVVVPRGGRSLVERVQRDARVPVIGHLEGLCHVYVDGAADLEMARRIVLNSKMRRTGICGAAETLLVDRACAATHLRPLVARPRRGRLRGARRCTRRRPPTPRDPGRRGGLAHRVPRRGDLGARRGWPGRRHPAHRDLRLRAHRRHRDRRRRAAARFLADVDSAIVVHNASTQFADGGEFGMGAEIGISTGRIHARGPVGAATDELQVPGFGGRPGTAVSRRAASFGRVVT
jgi:glutamate-5-semialdehyde dehydrogenase